MSRCLCITYDKGKWGSKVISKMAEFRCQDFKWPITSEIQTWADMDWAEKRPLQLFCGRITIHDVIIDDSICFGNDSILKEMDNIERKKSRI